MSAAHLASIFGTEKDKVNCPFYFKIGACRHGERCSRTHMRPTASPTIMMPNLYRSPKWDVDANGKPGATDEQEREHLEEFYVDMW